MSIDAVSVVLGLTLAFIVAIIVTFFIKKPNRTVLFYIDDDGVPRHCFENEAKKMTDVDFYSSVTEVNRAVKKRAEMVDYSHNRLGSKLVMKGNEESYFVVVSKDASPEEIRANLFHLHQFRLRRNGTASPAIVETDEGDGYVRYSFAGSSMSSGRGWNSQMFPNVDWVEDLVDDGQPINNIKYLATT